MAFNLLLVLYKEASTDTIGRWGWAYCVVCYGGPMGIATVLLGLQATEDGSIFGNAGVSVPSYPSLGPPPLFSTPN